MKSEKVNESFYKITGFPEELQPIIRKLTIKDKSVLFDPMVQRGLKPDTVSFFKIIPDLNDNSGQKSIFVASGLVPFLKSFGVDFFPNNLFNEIEVTEFIQYFNSRLPFNMYDYQELAVKESLLNPQQLCLAATGAGKSAIIAALCEFLRLKGLKGLILVPSISLTTQLHNDFKDYGLNELYNNINLIGGDNNIKEFSKQITISTWQSAMLIEDLSPLEFILVDECLHPDTNINTKKGLKKIKDIEIGDEVLTINEKKYIKEYKKVVKVHKNLSSEPMYIINEKLRITGNHKVLTSMGWKRAAELKIGDKILNANI